MVDPDLIRLVHDTKAIAALNKHLDEQIESMKEALVFAQGSEVVGLQRTINEFRRLKKLKETVLAKRD